jgi:hypothetical protein
MTKSTLAWAMFVLTLVPWLWATTGQEPHPPTNLEIPFLDRDPMGARWTAMGGAAMAAIDDGSAIGVNPAGLAKIRRIEMLGTIQKQSLKTEATWFGTRTSRSLSTTALREAAFAFPFPTYRGSLVLAGSVSRRNILDGYTVRAGVNPDDDLTYRDSEERSGFLTAWSGAMAVQVSPQAFLGLEAHGFSGSYDEVDRWDILWGGLCSDVRYAWNTDLGGYGGSVGMQYELSSLWGVGAVLKTPQRVTLEGEIRQPKWDEVGSKCVEAYGIIDDVATIPYSIGLGMALTPANLLVTLDVTYTDWHELKYPGPTRDLDTLDTSDNPYTGDYIYDPTVDIRLGAEYALSAYPVRFRAGFARVPLELGWFEAKKNRSSISLGAGAVVQSALAFDLAWQLTSFERESLSPDDSYSEKRTTNALLLTLAYRF